MTGYPLRSPVNSFDIHSCDDWLSCQLNNLDTVHAVSAAIREQKIWQEVVSGLDSIAVQFDPVRITPNEATDLFREQLSRLQTDAVMQTAPVTIPVCYDEIFAPDRHWIAKKMGLTVEALVEWHSGLEFTVAMLGFMPGFAYLRCCENITDIGRLTKPRQKVEAGSIGIIGNQSCIYSFSSPGGWPVIGRTPVKLFDPAKDQPALLAADQIVSFTRISKAEFDATAREELK
ncbi:5-oxoprolinase subunit B family protein [Parasphingorhabdus cellanae]|uniref:Allophanate hydrolase subunit 1 n=1 Tax=Parasphingorhabdus cellanae TaxID=2806553 RepID=A0ABX7T7L9_9SPHN|nr:allophanate hydrolase subunit 1 [Parasphingorhabdus cellanae]QTD55933.1 allophanate hydrolase subunit 1 [Parasphingorhabdus cellanae]